MSIYISLTTVPERLSCWNVFQIGIKSLLNQVTDKEYKVVVNIPMIYKNKNVPYVIPEGLTQLAASNPKLIINRITNDRGPIEKVIGCFNLATDPEDIIIAVDDDQEYYNDMLEYILKNMPRYPHSVIGFRGDTIIEKREFVQNGIKKYVLLGSHAYFPLKHDVHAAVPGHWHSVTYKRKFITDDFFTDKYMGVAASDDHIMSFYLRDKKIDYVMLAWNKEDNFIPVNYLASGMGKPSHHYPIKNQLGYDIETGFNVFRRMTNNHTGFLRDDFTKDWKFDCDHWYYEPPFSEADEKKEAPVVVAEPAPITEYPDGDAVPVPVDEANFTFPSQPPIITLTTIPSRLKAEYDAGIKSCITSLVNQDYPGEYKIHFNIPNKLNSTGEEYIIPQWLTDLFSKNPNFQIFRTDDIGPLTKLWPTMERTTDPETIIVVCDDDLVYHPDMLKEQVINQSRFPNSAVGYDGLTCWKPIYNDVRDHYITAIRKNFKVKILQHYKTISYKRKYLGDDFTSFMNDYYEWNDDILMSAYLGKNNIKRVSTYSEKFTPDYKTLEEWRSGNAACTFPVMNHTSHEGEEGCTIHRLANRPHFKNNPYAPDLIEKYID
jgi:hypothetical protein